MHQGYLADLDSVASSSKLCRQQKPRLGRKLCWWICLSWCYCKKHSIRITVHRYYQLERCCVRTSIYIYIKTNIHKYTGSFPLATPHAGESKTAISDEPHRRQVENVCFQFLSLRVSMKFIAISWKITVSKSMSSMRRKVSRTNLARWFGDLLRLPEANGGPGSCSLKIPRVWIVNSTESGCFDKFLHCINRCCFSYAHNQLIWASPQCMF